MTRPKKEHEFTEEQRVAIEKIKESLEKKEGPEEIGKHVSGIKDKNHQMEALWAIYHPLSFHEEDRTQNESEKNVAKWFHNNLPKSHQETALKWLKNNLEAYYDVENIERHFRNYQEKNKSLVSSHEQTQSKKEHFKSETKEKPKKKLLTKFSKSKEKEKKQEKKQENKQPKSKNKKLKR